MSNALLPRTVDARVRALAVATLVVQILIVGTGGAVRLTGSGLGCPTWPQCTDGSLVTTPEMGIHGVIEFGNRLLVVLADRRDRPCSSRSLRMCKPRRDLFVLALVHRPVASCCRRSSAASRCSSTSTRTSSACTSWSRWCSSRSPPWSSTACTTVRAARCASARVVSHARAGHVAVVAVTVLVGILTTGSGPHAGDGGPPATDSTPNCCSTCTPGRPT